MSTTFVAELQAAGIERSRIHALAKAGIDLSGLPVATESQRQDRASVMEDHFWRADLVGFAIGAILLALAILNGSTIWGIAAVGVMALSFCWETSSPSVYPMLAWVICGSPCATRSRPDDRRAKDPAQGVEQLVSRHHPEVDISGVSWTIHALGT